jgi:phage baseplate assembly protein gpV
MVATIHTGAPTTYIKINQDGTIEVKAPSSMTITAPTVTINGNVKVNGTVTATGDIKGGSVVLQTHVHGNVKAGSDNTSAPV